MTTNDYDVLGVGNAIVDVIAKCDDDFLHDESIEKGGMTLIDEGRAKQLYRAMAPAIEASGGSVANSMAGIASFGGNAAFIGKVHADQLGEVFIHDMRSVGVVCDVVGTDNGPATARSLILVTPDAQRSMSTYLGISGLLEPHDVDADLVRQSTLLFCEGYLWDVESAKKAIRFAMTTAIAAGNRVALSLSDTFCVDRHHSEFRELVAGPVDTLFANRSELLRLYETTDINEAFEQLGEDVALGCVTMGTLGSMLIDHGRQIKIPAYEVGEVVDTTGAGDQYAAGLLFGLAQGRSLDECGRLGSLAAAEVISHVGPR
ncbi:MAG: adenosine kinase, partial [Acidimicrobiia bacterium]|nr:adenosine kinase [Acidimicrobiia bacterium]